METALIDTNHQLVADALNAVAALEHLRLDHLPAHEHADAVRDLDRVRTSLEAHFSTQLHQFATHDTLRTLGVASRSGWLVAATGTSRLDAGRRAKLANTLAELPFLADAMLAGDVPIDAARIIARALNPRTRHLFDVFTQAAFVDAAKHKTLDALAADIEHWIDTHDPDGAAPDDPASDTLHANRVGDRVKMNGDLTLDTGLPVLAALEEEMAKVRAAEPRDPDGTLPWRPAANRRAEALARLLGRGAAAPDSTTRREPAFIAIHTGTDDTPRVELPDGSILPLRLVDTWAPDAHHLTLHFADPALGLKARFLDSDGNVVTELDLGRTARFANRAQRRALVARDRGCAFPGCNRTHDSCDAHHIIWWEHGGTTDLDNLVLLCRFHHVLIHAGLFSVTSPDHQLEFRLTDPDLPGWTGPVLTDTWHRHPTTDRRRKPPRP